MTISMGFQVLLVDTEQLQKKREREREKRKNPRYNFNRRTIHKYSRLQINKLNQGWRNKPWVYHMSFQLQQVT
jgi:hypothetical protein